MALVAAGALLAVPVVAQTTGSGTATPPAADTFRMTNARVLPADISRERLVTIMRGWSQSLGVQCDFCHAPRPAGSPTGPDQPMLDFASDANPHKEVARRMVRMTQAINRDHFAAAANRPGPPPVTCFTCHRGSDHPQNVPPAAPSTPPPAHQAPPTPSSPH